MGAPALNAPQARADALLAWWSAEARDLPWRETRDPWEILVSEVMAQQTQVARVAERWAAFLLRFPTPAACAAAPVADVLRLWSGLGYNRRALALHACAAAVVERHDGILPSDLASLVALPGIGPYTARAVAVFAFEHDHGVVDTNAARVLARWHGRALSAKEAQAAADASVPAGRSWAWNQAMLDLGAAICIRRSPRCADCPVRTSCGWAVSGRVTPDPADGSAGVSGGQSPFSGSDRQGRGRLVEALRSGEVPSSALAQVMGWPDDPRRAERVAATVVADGLAARTRDRYHLPGVSGPGSRPPAG